MYLPIAPSDRMDAAGLGSMETGTRRLRGSPPLACIACGRVSPHGPNVRRTRSYLRESFRCPRNRRDGVRPRTKRGRPFQEGARRWTRSLTRAHIAARRVLLRDPDG